MSTSDSDSSEKTPEKEGGPSSSGGNGSTHSSVVMELFPSQKTREGRKKETIRSLRNAFLDVGQDEVDPRWEPVLAELTSLVASCSFNEEELKWKPLPPIDSALSRKEKEEELKKRRYSEALRNCLLDDEYEDWIEIVEKALKWKEMRSHRKYYTYVLVDPRSHGPNGKQTDFEAFIRGVFYIGKGCGDRCASHFFKEEPKGMCKNCSKTVDLDDDMKTIVHKCCKSPTFNSDSLCTKCGHRKADQEESFSHRCCGSGKYPKKAFQTCPHCQKSAAVVDGMFSAHEGDEHCKGVKSQPTKGKCEVCKDEAAFSLEHGEIREHACRGSSLPPIKGKCEVCSTSAKDMAVTLKDGKIDIHHCHGSSLSPKKGKCNVCKSALKNGKKCSHNCPCSSQPPKKVWCVACDYMFSLEDGKIDTHTCHGSSQPPKEGVCNICEKLEKLYLIDYLKQHVKGLLTTHRGNCERSGKAVEEGRSAIKDEKMKSIWEAGETPIAVVCTQGDGTEEAEDKEAMMIIAYGTCNISKEDRNIEDYKQGKLVNKKSGTETRIETLDDSAKEGCGLNLLIQAWKNYQSNGKPRCAAQIKWPSNPKEVKSSS